MSDNDNGLVTCWGNFGDYCIDLWICEIVAAIVLGICLYQLIQRKKILKVAKRKNYIYLLIIVCLTCNIIFNIAQRTLLVIYFFQLYVYYVFLIYLVYYFGRKNVKIKTLKPQRLYSITMYCYGLICFFTFFLLWNIYDYIITFEYPYRLCQKQIFHIIRLVGFLIDIGLVVIAHALNNKIKRGLAETSSIVSVFYNQEEHAKKVNEQRIKFWMLVCMTFFGQLLYFIEDVYFLIQGPTQTCNIYKNIVSNNAQIFEYCVLLIIVLIELQLPFSVTIYAFWFKKQTEQITEQSIEVGDNYFATIKLKPEVSSNSTEQLRSLQND